MSSRGKKKKKMKEKISIMDTLKKGQCINISNYIYRKDKGIGR
jgi:hypothetical protein